MSPSSLRIGVNTFIWSASFGREQLALLPRLREAGFDGVEVPLFEPSTFPVTEVRRALEAEGLACTVCSIITSGKSLITKDDDVRRQTVQHVRDVIAVTADVGARLVDGPLYAPVGELAGRRRTGDEWQRLVESYQALTDTLDASDVTLAIEPLNRFETYVLNTAADAAALCDAVGHPRVGVAFDTFHANIEEKSIPGACALLGRHLKHVQVSENDRGTPGSGHVDWRGLFDALRALEYDGWLTIESFGPNLGAFSSAVAIWRDIEPDVNAIAFDGLAFLREAVRP